MSTVLIPQRFGALLRHTMRLEDRVFRYGGDEFIVLLPNTDEQGAVVAAHKLHDAIHEAFASERADVTASIGVAVLLPGETGEDWMKRADEALSAAKSKGADTVVTAR